MTDSSKQALCAAATVMVVKDDVVDLDGNHLCFGMESKPQTA